MKTALQVKYFVRTTGERIFNYDLEYETFVDKEHKPVESFIESLYKINDYNSVLLEDDLILCNNFKEEIEKVIALYPDSLINFFTMPKRYFTTHYSKSFCYNQCTYYPKGLAKIIADKMIEVQNIKISEPYDNLEYKALEALCIPNLRYRPCLVQHIDKKSIINNGKHFERNTIYFKDYLDKLGIDMIQACTLENEKRLNDLLEADKKIWYSD